MSENSNPLRRKCGTVVLLVSKQENYGKKMPSFLEEGEGDASRGLVRLVRLFLSELDDVEKRDEAEDAVDDACADEDVAEECPQILGGGFCGRVLGDVDQQKRKDTQSCVDSQNNGDDVFQGTNSPAGLGECCR